MAGERTPSTGHARTSSDDEISLREHVQRQLDNVQRQLDVIIGGAQLRIDGVQRHTDQEVSHIREHFAELLQGRRTYFESLIDELRIQLDERHSTHTRDTAAVLVTVKEHNIEQDRRYEQRFVAQERAVEVALGRVDKEFHEHLRSVQEETKAALNAADKAISKSEMATEKRFESVNEFRAQLADQAATFLPRKEGDVRMEALTEKVDLTNERLNALTLRVSSRLDVTESHREGGREAIMDKRTANGAVLALVGMGITIILAVITIVGFVIANMSR